MSGSGESNSLAAREILVLGNPVLWERCAPAGNESPSETSALIQDLSDTLSVFRETNGFGRGIAAPQIGAASRIIFIRMPGFSGPLLNPEIVWSSPQSIELWDDCFSLPNLMVRVSRAAQVRVNYFDEHWTEQTVDAQGGLSELLQHEIDHLDGILAIQRAVSPRAFSTRSEWQKQTRSS
jgi:peptide deformylase